MNNMITVISDSKKSRDKCDVKRCRRHTKYSIFNWDGRPALSRLLFRSCEKHLYKLVDRAMKKDKKLGAYKNRPAQEELEYWLKQVRTK